ncbi:hypothetical protein FRC12_001128 [Ceratobasidium sp. 428]|nr:hypothetical protein FRC12_001128 [Ceratobasidium sp. 428]
MEHAAPLRKANANRGRRGICSFKLFAIGFIAVLVIMDPDLGFSLFKIFWLFVQFGLLHVVDVLMQISMVPLRLIMIVFKVATGPLTKVPYCFAVEVGAFWFKVVIMA